MTTAPTAAAVDALLSRGLYDLWYPICPSGFVQDRPVSLRRLLLRLRSPPL